MDGRITLAKSLPGNGLALLLLLAHIMRCFRHDAQ
jgi:hypothetical protein